MKTLFKKFPVSSTIVLAIVLFASALFVSTLVNKGFVKQYIPYAAPLLLIFATWVLYKREGTTLKKIGLNLNIRNVVLLPLGALVGALVLLGAKFFRALYVGETFEVASSIDYETLLYAFYFILPQVTTEELLFRGYVFKKTIEVTNVVVANILFSILFMLIHVLDENVLSQVGMIVMLAITIPVGHLLFATALLKSKSIFFPIGLHLGNNWATRHLITSGKSNESILYTPEVVTFETWTPFIISIVLFNGFFLLVTFVIWKWDKILIFIKGKFAK